MCGIVGFVGKDKNALEVLINGLKHLEYRGYDSSGIAYINNNDLVIKKEKGKIINLEKSINFNDKPTIGIGHTRWATHGEASKINSHPHNYGKITIVHNGIIENYLELKEELINKGYKFKSETDTEIAAALLSYFYDLTNDMFETIRLFKEKAVGSYALGIICEDDVNNLYAVKNGSPLIIGIGNDSNYIASDIHALLDYTNKYIILKDEDFAKINNGVVKVYDKNNELKENIIKEYKGEKNVNSKDGYDHFMLKEIYEEPKVLDDTSKVVINKDFSEYKNIVIVACGSAMHAGLVGKYLIEKYGNKKVDVEIASEFRYKKLFLDKDTLVIGISQSGEAADTLEAIKIAKKHGCDTLGIINVEESTIAREVDNVLYTKAGSEIAVATTKAYSAQVLLLSMIAYNLAKNNDEYKVKKEIVDFMKDLKELPSVVDNILNTLEYKEIAKEIYDKNDIFFIGRGIDYALAMEGSLKLKEISYIHSEAYPAGELKHGTISLIDNNTPVIGIVTDKEIYNKTISNLKEVKSRGANVIYITTNNINTIGDFYSKKIVLKEVNPLLQPLINIIPLQLISYEVAKLNNCDIDKPKNLAKSVTVE